MTPGIPHGLLRRSLVLPCSLAALGAAALPLMAQLPTARLDTVFPQGLRAGTETEVTIAGADLDGVDRLLFSDPGLSAVPVDGLKFKVTASAGMALLYIVVIAATHKILTYLCIRRIRFSEI